MCTATVMLSLPHRFQPPDHRVQLLAAEDLLRVAHQKQQQLVLFIFQRQFHVVFGNGTGGGVHRKRACRDALQAGCLWLQPGILGQVCLDPRHQLAGGKRLFDIIIGAKHQAANFVHILATRRHHQDGDVLLGPYGLADGKTVHTGQHHIQQNQVKGLVQYRIQPGGAVQRDSHGIAAQFQIVPLNGGDVSVIFHNQNVF